MTVALTCQRVCVDIEAACILSNVDLTIHEGEFVAILGSNGSGKTTLMRAILGLLPVTSGTIHLFGFPLKRFRAWHKLAYVPQRLHSAGAVSASPRRWNRWDWLNDVAIDSTNSPVANSDGR